MNRTNKIISKHLLLVLTLAIFVLLCFAGCSKDNIQKVYTDEAYTYINPDESKADTDEGFVIDGVLDEEAYRKNNWLYLSNKEGGADVEIAMTSYFGEKGMYFVYDVTEGNPIYVNLDRATYMNSCVEMYLAPSSVTNMKGNSVFEIDLLPTGDMNFKKSNGKGSYVNVATAADLMAVLGTTTKGGEINTEDCYGYCLELFIPWEYMEKFDLDAQAMKDSYVYIDPAHITSYNYAGTDMNVDRYFYYFAQQHGAGWSNVYQYFRFDGDGVQGTVPVELIAGENYTIQGAPSVVPGMKMNVTVTPENGYALKSILINGEEYIHSANFNEDGSVTITERGVADGVKISAVAEPVTDGNKTLTGTVTANKLMDGNLKGASASYKGPTGERPLELDDNGKFVLTNLKQGYYTILIEKEGYERLTRSIYVNRDMEVSMSLEYQTFTATGSSWILDKQNDGILQKFGGSGELLTKDKYSTFTVEAAFRYDEKLAELGTTDSFKEQRQGLKVAFSNEKIWHIDMLKQNGKYIVQYAKHSGDNSLTGWKTIYTLSGAEIAKFTDKGVTLSIQRDGKYANVYLDGKLIAVEIFDNDYSGYTAQIGFEAWVANREVVEIPYKITSGTSVNLKNTYFKMHDGWDVSRQYWNMLSLPQGGYGSITFADKIGNIDLALKVRDYADGGNTYARTDILFVFENGKKMSFSIDGNSPKVQSMFDEKTKETYINTGWKTWYNLTEEEIQLLQGDGVDFRVVRYGTEVSMYVGGRLVGVADLTDNSSGVTANMKATVSIRHYDDAGVNVQMPFSVKKTFDRVNITLTDTVTTQKKQYFVGDTVKVLAASEENILKSLSVNGASVSVHQDGTYSFLAQEKNYDITGTVESTVFKPDSQWDITMQKTGVVSIPERIGDSASLYTAHDNYRDVSVTVKDVAQDGKFQMQFRFIFQNGKEYQIRLYYKESASQYEIQTMSGATCINDVWKWHANLTMAQTEKLLTTGIQFRVALVGTEARIYLDNLQVATYELGSYGLQASDVAQIRLMMYGNTGAKNLEIPYTLGGVPETIDIVSDSAMENGKITTSCKDNIALVDEKVVLTAAPDTGYYLTKIAVTDNSGKEVALTQNGSQYSFVAKEGVDAYTVSAEFEPAIIGSTDAKNNWDLGNQFNGTVTLVSKGTDDAYIETTADTYREAAILVKDVAQSGTFEMQLRFYFTNGTKYQVRLYYKADANQYEIQNMDGIKNWEWISNLSAAQAEKLKTQGVEFRAKLVGTSVELYVDDVLMAHSNAARHDLSAGIDETTTARIRFHMVGNSGVENLVLPFEVKEEEPEVIDPIFDTTDSANSWDLSNQFNGTVTLVSKGTSDAYVQTTADTYREAAILVKDVAQSGTFESQIRFYFTNGTKYQVRLYYKADANQYEIQNMDGIKNWEWISNLSAAQAEKLKTQGVEFRAKIVGTKVELYVDNVLMAHSNAARHDLSSGIDANTTARIRFHMVGNNGVENLTLPFELKEHEPVEAQPVFGSKDDKNDWDLSNQDSGSVTLVSKGADDAYVKTSANTYREAAVTVRDVNQDGKFQMQIRFYFTNGSKYQVRLYYNADTGEYQIQNMDGITGWGWIKNLSAAQIAKLTGDQGVEFRVKIVGTKVELYVDGQKMAHSSVARHDLSSGISESTTAQIQFHMVGNNGAENIVMPFELG